MTDLPIEVIIKSAQRLHMGWWLFYVFFLPCTILHTRAFEFIVLL